MNFKTKSELLVPVLRINVISNLGCRSLCMAFLPPFSGVFRLSLSGSWPGIPCRRLFGFQGSIGVLLVAYHAFKKFFRTWQVRFWGSKPDIVGPVRWTALNRAYHNNTRIFRKWYFRFLPSKPEVIVPVWCNIEWINADFYKTLFLRKFTYSAPVKVQNWRILVLNIGFGRSTTSVFEFEFEKIGFKNCEVVPACPACYNCVGSESSQPVSYTDAQT